MIIVSFPVLLKAQRSVDFYKSELEQGVQTLQVGRITESEKHFNAILIAFRLDEEKFMKDLFLAGKGFTQEEMDSFVTKTIYFTQACFFNGYLLLESEKPYEAIFNFKQSIELDSTFVDGYLGLADCYISIYKYPQALKLCSNVLSADPENIDALLKSSSICLSLKMYDEAIDVLNKILLIDKNCSICYPNRGYNKLLKGDYEGALNDFEIALKNDPNDPYAINNKGYTLHKIGKTKIGLDLIDRSISLFPNNHYAFLYKALIYFDKNEKEKACLEFNKAINIGFEAEYNDLSEDLLIECK